MIGRNGQRGSRRCTIYQCRKASWPLTVAPLFVMDLTYRIVRRLLRDDDVQFSRNKNFEAYEDPQVKRAMRLYRHLHSLEEDLLALEDPSMVRLEAVEETDERVTVRLVFVEQKGRRISYLKPREWELLLENERVSDILRGLLSRADAETRRILRRDLSDHDELSAAAYDD